MLIGQSPQIMKIKKMIREIAKTNDHVLIIGEVSTGRKQAAREIHHRSSQKRRPFIVLNCTAVGDTIQDVDLFGTERDTEQGIERKIGILEQANRGILFLENIDDLKPEYQQKLMNISKEGRFQKISDDSFHPISLRVIASTPDEKLFKKESIRKDLLSLISTFTLHIPPLRKRKQDIPFLFSSFLENTCEDMQRELPIIPAEIFESLIEYDWPGNVLELKNSVRNLVLMSPEDKLSIEYLPFEIKKHPFEFLEERDLPEAVAEVERYMIRKALRKFAGNQTKAAKLLNVSEAALRYKMKKFGYSRKAF
jgi:DNA-binding NtrC family response regulator